MLNGKKRSVEENLKFAFESGYLNAAASLSKLTSNKISYNNLHFGFHSLESEYFHKNTQTIRNGMCYLITTEIFGDIIGKSYLLISEKEFELLTNAVPIGKNADVNLKEEYIKELDNILSASVITCLSNEFKKKMYGDVPNLIGKVPCKIENIIYDDFSEQAEEVYVNTVHFSFEGNLAVYPYFVWVIDSHTIKVPVQSEI